MSISKVKIIEAIEAMPQDEFDDIDEVIEEIDEIILLEKVERGLEDMREGRVISRDELNKIIKQW